MNFRELFHGERLLIAVTLAALGVAYYLTHKTNALSIVQLVVLLLLTTLIILLPWALFSLIVHFFRR